MIGRDLAFPSPLRYSNGRKLRSVAVVTYARPFFSPVLQRERSVYSSCVFCAHGYDSRSPAFRPLAFVSKKRNMRVSNSVHASNALPYDSEPASNVRRMSSVIWRLRGGGASGKSGSRSSRSRDSYGVLGLSLSGEALRDTHAVTSVVAGARVAGARSGTTMSATDALDASHTAPFVLLEHDSPRNFGTSATAPSTTSLAGLHALVYVLRGAATLAHSRAADGEPAGARLCAGDGALLDSRAGSVLRVVPAAGPFEAVRVWVRVGDHTRGAPSRRSARDSPPTLEISRALPDYALSDTATGAECARVRVLLGDGAPLERAESARASTRALLVGDSGYDERPAGSPAYNVGVYDLRIASQATVRLRVRSARVLVYVREGAVRLGSRVVKMHGLAALHGPIGGTITVAAVGDEAASCFMLEGCGAKENLCYSGDGLAASTSRALRRLVRREKKGEFGKAIVKVDMKVHEETDDVDGMW